MIKKISVVGSGAVGSTLAFNLLNRCNLDELVLIDIAGDLAKGIALDLEDTRGFLNFSTEVKGTSDFSQIKDSDIVVVTAGIARREGMTRIDLLKTNVAVAKEVSRHIKEFCPQTIVIAVTNPLDVITYVIAKETGFPSSRVIGMGSSLDTSRLLNILHKKTGIAVSSLEGFVYGAHSKDMMVSTDRLKVKGQSLSGFLSKEDIEKVKDGVQLRGAQIVGCLKNKSASFAPSLSCCFLIEAIANNKNEVIPVAVLLNGEYGVTDACMGVPCVINREGIAKIVEMELTVEEKEEISKTEALFQSVRAELAD
jgi:malate dehydrogenase